MNNQQTLPNGQVVTLVPREQLRFRSHGRRFSIPYHLRALMEAVPTPPPTFDLSKGEALKYPILGNDRYGCCYYAAVEHNSQTWTGNSGIEYQFDEQATIKRYLQLSGGDNGLDDATIIPEWKSGIIGPNGSRKIRSFMTIAPGDSKSVALAMWAFGGLIWTASLADAWIKSAGPGVVWNVGNPNPNNGHAMHLTGINARGNYDVRTWGLSPPVQVTLPALTNADSEIGVSFSTDQFNAAGFCAFTGMSWDQKNLLWQYMGGKDQGASPFPAPTPLPPVPPTPVPPVPPTPIPPTPVPPSPSGMTLAAALSTLNAETAYLIQHNPKTVLVGSAQWKQIGAAYTAALTKAWPAGELRCLRDD